MPYLNDHATKFDSLIADVNEILDPSSGLDSSGVNPVDIQSLMSSYMSDPVEWDAYALEDASKTYTRNLIDEGNGKSNLLILVWTPGKGCLVHDHADAHCVMKILKGSLRETQYFWPDQDRIRHGETSPLRVKKETVYGENEVTYMSDKLGLHKISNPDSTNVAVSLHLYTPPNAATHGFSICDEQTGRAKHIKQSNFYSVRGVKC